MANKSYTYKILWTFKEEGNRAEPEEIEVRSTTVPRAISKAIRTLNVDPEQPGDKDGRGAAYLDKDHEDFLKASDIMIVDCRNITRGWKA